MTDKKTEALRLALEALDAWKSFYGAHWDEIDEQAITAIREALAEQPAQRCKYGNEPTSCTSSPMDCQCAIDAVFEQPAQVDPCIDGSCSCCWSHLDEQPAQTPVAVYRAGREGEPYHVQFLKHMEGDEVFLYTSPQPAQQQEPVALFEWLPEGATHIGRISVRTCAGGLLEMSTHAFKYDNGVLKVYVTDNDNEYPGWRDAKNAFFHLKFPVIPLYTSPQPSKPWVGLTDEERDSFWKADQMTSREWDELFNAIEAKLKDKNGY